MGYQRIAPGGRADRNPATIRRARETSVWSPAPDGMVRLFPGSSGFPTSPLPPGTAFPDREVPEGADSRSLAPDLVVEVLSESNTPAEMERKRSEYFAAGVRFIWEVDPQASHGRRSTLPMERSTVLDASQTR